CLRDRGPLGADAERIRRVLDVRGRENTAVAREHGGSDVVVRVRRVRVRRRGVGLREQLFGGHTSDPPPYTKWPFAESRRSSSKPSSRTRAASSSGPQRR